MTSTINMTNDSESEWKTYVPPNKRKRLSKSKNSDSTKEVNINSSNLQEFPELGLKKTESICNESKLNFAILLNEDEKTETDSDVAEGFVKITRDQQTGKSVIDNGPSIVKQHVNEVILPSGLTHTQETQLETLVMRWQLYRDTMDINYGDGSPFNGMKRLTDPLSDDDYDSDTELTLIHI